MLEMLWENMADKCKEEQKKGDKKGGGTSESVREAKKQWRGGFVYYADLFMRRPVMSLWQTHDR
jgi:hypothetical protein